MPASGPEDLVFDRDDGRNILGEVGQVGQQVTTFRALQRGDESLLRIEPQFGKTVVVEAGKSSAVDEID